MSSTAPDPIGPITGGCQCGAIRYALAAIGDDVNVCHCRMCQKAGGGPYMVFVNLPAAAVTWTRGAPAWFASSDIAARGFCAACGTPLTYRRVPEQISLTTGSLDDPAAAVPGSRLASESVLAWCEDITALPTGATADWMASIGQAPIRSAQHPDHDT